MVLLLSAVVEDIAIGAGGLGFDSPAGQVDAVLPLLRRFFGAALPRR